MQKKGHQASRVPSAARSQPAPSSWEDARRVFPTTTVLLKVFSSSGNPWPCHQCAVRRAAAAAPARERTLGAVPGTETSPSSSSSVLLHFTDFLANAASTGRDCAKYSPGQSAVDSFGTCSAFSSHFPQLPFLRARRLAARGSSPVAPASVHPRADVSWPCGRRIPFGTSSSLAPPAWAAGASAGASLCPSTQGHVGAPRLS